MPFSKTDRHFMAWLVSTIFTRLTVTSIPMVSIVGIAAANGSFVLGGFTSGAYAIGESVGAIWLTPLLSRRNVKKRLFQGCAVCALLLFASGILAVNGAPYNFSVPLLVFITGLLSAPIPGVLRSSISQSSSSPARAMSLDNAINQSSWVIGPVLGVAVVHSFGTLSAFFLLGIFLVIAMMTTPRAITNNYHQSSGTESTPDVRIVMNPIVASAVIMAVTASFDTLVPILLTEWSGTDVRTGWVLAALAGSSVLISALIGVKTRWSGKEKKSAFFTLLVVFLIGATGFTYSFPTLMAVAVVLGAFQAPAMIFRQQIIADKVPKNQQATAFSYLYAAGGIGYSLTAALTPSISKLANTQCASVAVAVFCLAALVAAHLYTKNNRSPQHQ
ncbi:MFS transporter [Corynebacterium sp. CCM 8862]|uniref:MFS transporter n=1 Tax=Corynebacterium mendelii TaxID=2765362 RepID=A0A939E018_9CORY|nr:MFS transporter [Corynebacterium mendelii]MBN9644425.1 MFS transporter [Corynebacterium mendelii]